MSAIRIDHVNLVVADMERSVRFYEDLFGLRRGFEVVLEGAWVEELTALPGARARCVFLEIEPSAARLELLQYFAPTGEPLAANSLPNTLGLRHVAFLVEDLDALATRLQEQGVPIVGGPSAPPFAVGSLGRKRLLYFLDPDGVLVEAASYEQP